MERGDDFRIRNGDDELAEVEEAGRISEKALRGLKQSAANTTLLWII
jgi:hypothetical protein